MRWSPDKMNPTAWLRKHLEAEGGNAVVREVLKTFAAAVKAPEPLPLDGELEVLLRRMRLPHIRRAAPEVLAT